MSVLVRLKDTHVIGKPGDVIVAFGHNFIMQPDGTATMRMHEDFIPTELAAGRIEIIEKPVTHIKDPIKDANTQYVNIKEAQEQNSQNSELDSIFDFELDNYFGVGSVEKFRNKLTQLPRKELIEKFAQSRLQIELPQSMTKAEMIAELIATVKAKMPDKKEPVDVEDDES